MAKTRRAFTPEFKRDAVARLESSWRSQSQIAADLGIQPSMLRNWRAVIHAAPSRSRAVTAIGYRFGAVGHPRHLIPACPNGVTSTRASLAVLERDTLGRDSEASAAKAHKPNATRIRRSVRNIAPAGAHAKWLRCSRRSISTGPPQSPCRNDVPR
jgi:hypothetical protein